MQLRYQWKCKMTPREYIKEQRKFMTPETDAALFWAGRMVMCTESISTCSVYRLSEYLTYLCAAKDEYNKVIFNE